MKRLPRERRAGSLRAAAVLWCAALVAAAGAAPATTSAPERLRALLDGVRSEAARESERLRDREARFRAAVDERDVLVRQARADRQAAEKRADEMRREYARGEERLADLETELDTTAGDLKALFSVVRQVAGDAATLIDGSLVSAQLPGRRDAFEPLMAGNRVPSVDELRTLWATLLEEMTLNGEVARFEAPVISAKGEEEARTVTRIGAFTAVAQGDYLRYLPESGRLLALGRQPATVTRAQTLAFESSAGPVLPVALDPSRGSILSLIVQTPRLSDRVQQGGIIGYIIIAIGVVGLALSVQRLAVIGWESLRLRRAARGAETSTLLDRLDAVVGDPALQVDHEALAVKLDEAVNSAAYRLRRGFGVLVIFAAVSPLLGLLGTVTGMIETFQVITLFGAGDPRLMSGGISQALVTTQLGLSVAIPLLLIHSFLQGRASDIESALEQRSADLFAQLAPRQTQQDGSDA